MPTLIETYCRQEQSALQLLSVDLTFYALQARNHAKFVPSCPVLKEVFEIWSQRAINDGFISKYSWMTDVRSSPSKSECCITKKLVVLELFSQLPSLVEVG